jgi:alpha-tubulin suppressor-like RCC1 family protein
MATLAPHCTDTSPTQASKGRWAALWHKMPALVFLCLVALTAAPAAGRAAEGPGAPGVVAWGENEVGQLGDGNTAESDAPVAVPGLSDATALSIGRRFGLALLREGTVMSWGENSWGQLGDGTHTGPETCHAAYEAAAGYTVGCSTTPVPVSGLSGVVAIAAGDQHSLALLSNGNVMAWGDNERGQLGNGSISGPDHCYTEQEPTQCSTSPVPVSGLSEVTAIAAGQNYNLALLRNGTVMAWGSNGWGELGDGTSSWGDDVPAAVTGLSGVTAIAAGGGSSLALLSNGTVMAWGANEFGQLGDGTLTQSDVPVAVSGLSGVSAIGGASLALRNDGTIMAWGSNISGQLGDGTRTGPTECFPLNFCSPTPVPVSELKGARAIAAGSEHNLALLSDGEVMAWGENWYGQLGTGNTVSTDTPVPVPGLIDVSEIAAGEDRSFAYGVLREARPEVSGLSPVSGSQMGGTAVTITGKNLAGATAVQFGTQTAASYTVNSDESITALSPPGRGIVGVTVKTRYGTNASEPAYSFTYESLAPVSPVRRRRGPLVRLRSARLRGDALLLTLEGACASCGVRLTIAAVPKAGQRTRASSGDAARVSRNRRPPRSIRRSGVVQAKTVTLTSAKELSLKISLNAAARALLRAARKLSLTAQGHEGATLVIDQTLRLTARRGGR